MKLFSLLATFLIACNISFGQTKSIDSFSQEDLEEYKVHWIKKVHALDSNSAIVHAELSKAGFYIQSIFLVELTPKKDKFVIKQLATKKPDPFYHSYFKIGDEIYRLRKVGNEVEESSKLYLDKFSGTDFELSESLFLDSKRDDISFVLSIIPDYTVSTFLFTGITYSKEYTKGMLTIHEIDNTTLQSKSKTSILIDDIENTETIYGSDQKMIFENWEIRQNKVIMTNAFKENGEIKAKIYVYEKNKIDVIKVDLEGVESIYALNLLQTKDGMFINCLFQDASKNVKAQMFTFDLITYTSKKIAEIIVDKEILTRDYPSKDFLDKKYYKESFVDYKILDDNSDFYLFYHRTKRVEQLAYSDILMLKFSNGKYEWAQLERSFLKLVFWGRGGNPQINDETIELFERDFRKNYDKEGNYLREKADMTGALNKNYVTAKISINKKDGSTERKATVEN